jgi:WD40 repeat protein
MTYLSPFSGTFARGLLIRTITQTGELITTLRSIGLCYGYGVNSIAISPDGQTLVSGSMDETIKVWHLQTGELIRTIKANSKWHSDAVSSVAISPDGQTLVSGT